MRVNTEISRRQHGGRYRLRNVFEAVGRTPLWDVSDYSPHPGVKIYAKAEWQNPGRSVKDRPASRIVCKALHSGALTPEKYLLDSTSGNTGVAYALFCAACGLRVRLVMPANVSSYQKRLMRAYAAEVVYSDAQEGSDGAIRLARALLAEAPQRYYYADQYNNAENWRAHYQTTALEIWHQTRGRLTHFVAGLGTSGTFVGTARRLRRLNPAIQLVAVQPDSPWHGLEGLKHMATAIVPGIYDASLPHRQLEVATETAQDLVKHLARRKGVLVGLSAGAALAAARQLAATLSQGCIVTIFPDGGHRYLEESFWDGN